MTHELVTAAGSGRLDGNAHIGVCSLASQEANDPRRACDVGRELWRKGRREEALHYLAEAAQASLADKPLLCLAMAEIHAASGSFDEARQTLSDALQIWPNDPRIHTAMGNLAARSFFFRTARLHYENARQLAPDDSSLSLHIAETRMALCEFRQARDALLIAQAQSPGNAQIAERLREVQLAEDRWREGQRLFAREAARFPATPAGRRDAIEYCLNQGLRDATLFGAMRLVSEFPGQLETWLFAYQTSYGQIYWLDGSNTDATFHLLTEIATRFGKYHIVCLMVGRALIRAGRVLDAARFYATTPAEMRGKAPSLRDQVRVASALGRSELESELLRTALHSNSSNEVEAGMTSLLCCRAAKQLHHAGKLAQAEHALKRAIQLGPSHEQNIRDTYECALPTADAGIGLHARPRIALCISGQLRGFRSVFPRLREAISAEADVDVFVHSWRQVGVPSMNVAGSLPFLAAKGIATNTPDSAFQTAYPRTYRLLTAPMKEATEAEIGEFYGAKACIVESDETFTSRFFPQQHFGNTRVLNSFKMFYKIHACDLLRRQYEQTEGLQYDLVVRLRPDLPLVAWSLHELAGLCQDGVSVCAHYLLENGYGDSFGCGRPEAMAIYADIWPRILAARSSEILPACRDTFAERLLMKYLLAQGLGMRLSHVTQFGKAIWPRPEPSELRRALQADLAEGGTDIKGIDWALFDMATE